MAKTAVPGHFVNAVPLASAGDHLQFIPVGVSGEDHSAIRLAFGDDHTVRLPVVVEGRHVIDREGQMHEVIGHREVRLEEWQVGQFEFDPVSGKFEFCDPASSW